MSCSATMRLLAFMSIVVGGCADRAATRIEIEPLAEGEWIVVDASGDGAILRQMHTTRPSQRRAARESAALAVLEDTLRTVEIDTVLITVGDSIIPLVHVRGHDVYMPLHGQPHLLRSPTNPRRYTFEHNDAIWLFTAPDSIRKLTQDDDLSTLRGQQQEGVAILYWSTNPVWSSNGELIAFVSNREAFRARVQGQSLWMLDPNTEAQQALYNEPRVSVRNEGALGPEFIFISSEQPGVFSIHPQTRRVTLRANGYVAGTHPRGEAVVINDNGRLIVLREQSTDTLPDPPAGRTWNPNAFISPSAKNIALFSSDGKGDYTLHVFQQNNETLLRAAVPGGPSYGPVWADDRTIIFAAMRIGGELTTYRADLR
jgi:hypothetical protein